MKTKVKTCVYSLDAGYGRVIRCDRKAVCFIDGKPICSKHAEVEKPFSEYGGRNE